MKRFRFAWNLCFLLAVCTEAVQADISDSQAKGLGLEVSWRGQIERGRQTSALVSMAIWPHSSIRTEYVDVLIGDRIVRRISADEIDREKLRLSVENLSANKGIVGYEKNLQELTDHPPRIGLSGARQRGEKLVNDLTLLGRKNAKLGEPVSQPVTYLLTTSATGSVQLFDAESGKHIWTNYAGTQNRRTLPAGVNDKYVGAVNGSQLFVFDLSDGKLLNQRELVSTPGGGPLPVGESINVPTLTGGMIGYDALNPQKEPWRQVSEGRSVNSPVHSVDRTYFAWTTSPKYVFVAKVGKVDEITSLWKRLESGSKISSQVVAVDNGFVAVATDGVVYSFSNAREEGIRWRLFTGEPSFAHPVAGTGVILVVSTTGTIHAIDIETGILKWSNRQLNVAQIVAISKEKIYARSQGNSLMVLEAASGKLTHQLNNAASSAFTNSINDRIYLCTNDGRVTCLRESGDEHALPRMNFSIEPAVSSDSDSLRPMDGTSPSLNPASESPIFGIGTGTASPFGAGSGATVGSPFGNATSSPFGDSTSGSARGNSEKIEDPFSGR